VLFKIRKSYTNPVVTKVALYKIRKVNLRFQAPHLSIVNKEHLFWCVLIKAGQELLGGLVNGCPFFVGTKRLFNATIVGNILTLCLIAI
jgi:hypothetical protein